MECTRWPQNRYEAISSPTSPSGATIILRRQFLGFAATEILAFKGSFILVDASSLAPTPPVPYAQSKTQRRIGAYAAN